MPPRHLIIPAGEAGRDMAVMDCQSMPVEKMTSSISTDSHAQQILFAPAWALTEHVKTYLHSRGLALAPLTSPYLHLDTDHLGESIAMLHRGNELWRSFSYQAWVIDRLNDTTRL
jgi:hypothetical protein